MDEFDPAGADVSEARQDAEKIAKFEAVRDDEDLKWLMSGKRGRRIVWVYLADQGIGHSVFNPDALTMAFLAGQREKGMILYSRLMGLCPEEYVLMTQENMKNG